MKDRKFSTPVSMKVTQEQYERDLKKPLEELGYELSETVCAGRFPNLVLDNDDSMFWFCTHTQPTHLDHYNPKLFLALAAMTEGSNLIIGEYVYLKINKDIFPMSSTGNIPDESGYRKATKEELINHFTEDMKTQERFPFELDLEGARKIMKVCCEDWKNKLGRYWGADLFENERVFVNESFYKEMRKACDDKQHKVLDSVFGKDEKSVEDELYRAIAFADIDITAVSKLIEELLETFDIKFKK